MAGDEASMTNETSEAARERGALPSALGAPLDLGARRARHPFARIGRTIVHHQHARHEAAQPLDHAA